MTSAELAVEMEVTMGEVEITPGADSEAAEVEEGAETDAAAGDERIRIPP